MYVLENYKYHNKNYICVYSLKDKTRDNQQAYIYTHNICMYMSICMCLYICVSKFVCLSPTYDIFICLTNLSLSWPHIMGFSLMMPSCELRYSILIMFKV